MFSSSAWALAESKYSTQQFQTDQYKAGKPDAPPDPLVFVLLRLSACPPVLWYTCGCSCTAEKACFSPNRFTCEGFLLLLKGCMLGPDDFEFVSGLVFLAA